MPRRIHVGRVITGEISLDDGEAHHVRNVLRLDRGMAVEVFDDAGNIGAGAIGEVGGARVTVVIESILPPESLSLRLTIASAIPKAARGDWMIEKLSELGVDAFVPLATERGIVLPDGVNKLRRWERIAAEAAKQSHRRGVMGIGELTPLEKAIGSVRPPESLYCSTAAGAMPLPEAADRCARDILTLFIGPEGGWSSREIEQFDRAGIAAVALTRTILRIETAAIAAAALVLAMATAHRPPEHRT